MAQIRSIPQLQADQGTGRALTREKCVAAAAFRFIVVVDEAKMVPRLTGVVPVEMLPFATADPRWHQLRGWARPSDPRRCKKDGPVITDNGNFIVDCQFDRDREPWKHLKQR